jgi:cAMP-dependent protein kinase regulator
VIPKSDEALLRIRQACENNLLFKSLDKDQLKTIIDAMEEKRVAAGEVIIEQDAENGEFFYVIESGDFEVFRRPIEKTEQSSEGDIYGDKVFAYKSGGSFGELALMYNCPRAATVKSCGDGILWLLDRNTFRQIVIETTAKKRKRFEHFLENVAVLQNLTRAEQGKIADCMQVEEFADKEIIISQGEPGDKIYFLLKGSANVTQLPGGSGLLSPRSEHKQIVPNSSRTSINPSNEIITHPPLPLVDSQGSGIIVGRLLAGSYFGERALLTQEPRAATVRSSSDDTQCAVIDRATFERLCGPLRSLMQRHIDTYLSAEQCIEEKEQQEPKLSRLQEDQKRSV